MLARLLAHPLARLIRLDKPIGTLLLLWPSLVALWFASDGWPGWHLLAVFLLGTFCMRSAGCALNDYADRDIDAQVERTQNRPLATGQLYPLISLLVAALLVLAAAALVLTTNWLAVTLAVLGLLVTGLYPYVKRRSNYPQLVLGVAFAWGVPIAWAASAGTWTLALWVLFAATWFWIVAYDTEYAMRDRADDLKVGVGSTAIGFGPHERLAVFVCLALALGGWWWAGQLLAAGLMYQLGLVLVGVLFLEQVWLIRTRAPEAGFRAFNLNGWAGAAWFAGTLADSLVKAVMS